MSRRDKAKSPAELRRHAEAFLSERANGGSRASPSVADTERLVHELQVHQIELEMQKDELIRSRAELETALETYSELYDFAPIGYFTVDRGGHLVGLNLTGARLLGSERARLVGKALASFIADADRPSLAAMLTRTFAGEGAASCVVAMARPGDDPGRTRHVQFTSSASPGDDQCRVVALDVSERKRAEEQARTSQRLEAIGQLAGGVAHDFNNLLTIIMANADEAIRSLGEEAPLHENLLDLRAAAQRGAELTRQLLTFSRRHVVQTKVVDVNPLARGMASMLRRLLGDSIDLALSLAGDVGRIAIDPSQLDQVLMNLAINARDAMPEGGRLTLSTANAELDERSADDLGLSVKPGPFVVVRVGDTGIGMDRETMAQIFEPFFTTKETGRGTGLGLSTVYAIVEQSGGGVSVHSKLGGGTTFEIYLPRTEAPAASDESRGARVDAAPRGTETILVIEDEGALRRIAERILSSAGYSILSASSGAEALRIAEEHSRPIHLALSDVMMPSMTGVVFAERLMLVHPETRVLFMSGYADGAFGRSGFDQAVHFIGKPFSASELRVKAREVLDAPRPTSDPTSEGSQPPSPATR